jgi:hypothetical protein
LPQPLIDHALSYVALGMAVLPLHHPVVGPHGLQCSCGRTDCRQSAKHPYGRLVPRGLLDASKDRSRIRGWIGNEALNIGITTGAASGVIVLDIDPRHEGDLALAELEKQFGALPATWRFLTGGGGEHILFRHPGGTVRNSAGALARGIDVRGDGGYIVAPPSRHICGRNYAISVDHHPDDIPLADIPAWLKSRIINGTRTRKGTASKPSNWRAHVVGMHGEGQRNDAVARLTGHLLRARIDPRVCLSLVIAWNRLHCQPPLEDDEVASTVRSIAAREIARRSRVDEV